MGLSSLSSFGGDIGMRLSLPTSSGPAPSKAPQKSSILRGWNKDRHRRSILSAFSFGHWDRCLCPLKGQLATQSREAQ